MLIGDLVLLTGAGFTSNFGGYLAQQMFSEIVGHQKIHRKPRVKQAFLTSGNYEATYTDIMKNSGYSEEEIEQIRDEPLLYCYLQLFGEVLAEGNPKTILIIGYSFGDQHINDGLVKAVTNGSRLFIINPRKDEIQFQEWLRTREDIPESERSILLAGLVKYFQYSLKDFLYDYETPEWKRIADDLCE